MTSSTITLKILRTSYQSHCGYNLLSLATYHQYERRAHIDLTFVSSSMNSVKLQVSNKGQTLSSKEIVARIFESKHLIYDEQYIIYLQKFPVLKLKQLEKS